MRSHARVPVARFIFLLLLGTLAFGLARTHDARAQAPAFQAAGTPVSGTGAVSPAWPAHQAGDVALLFVESRGNQAGNLSTAAGFASIGQTNTGGGGGTRLTVYWARATASAMPPPTVNDPGNHVYAQIITYRGVLGAGNPWNVQAGNAKTPASNTVSLASVTTTVPDTLVVQAVSRNNDSAAAAFSNLANAGLTGIAERSDGGTTSGDGGGFAVWDGVKATTGAIDNTTADISASVLDAYRTIALRPGTYYSRVATGNWGTAGTWSTAGCGGGSAAVPPAGADVVICAGNTVTLNQNSQNLNSLTIQGTGILNIGSSNTTRTLTVSGNVDNAGMLRYGNNNGDHNINIGGQFVNGGTFTHINNSSGGARSLTVTGLISNSGTFRFAGRANAGEIMTVNANGGITNNGTLDVNTGSSNTHALNVGGDFTNNDTVSFAPDANSLVTTGFNGAAAQNVTGSVAGTDFYNVTVSNLNGLTLTGTHNMSVWNTLNLNVDGAIITTGSNLVQIGRLAPTVLAGSVTNANANRFVNGNLQRVINATGTYNFDVGTIAGGNRWTPVQVQLGAFTTAGLLRVSTTPGDHPQIGGSGFDSAKSVNRYWTLTNTGLVFPANAGNRARFTFVAADIDGIAVPANFNIGRYTGSWTLTPPPAPNAQPLFTEMSGASLTSGSLTGDFQVAETTPVVTTPGNFNAFESGTTPNPGAVTGQIYTKLAGTGFSLDVVAILGGVQLAAFTGTVAVDLVTGATGGLGCGSPAAITASQNVNLASGRGTTGGFAVASAFADVRVRIRYPAGAPTVTACSSDNFTVRPTAFSSVTAPALANTMDTGIPFAKAGAAFTIDAVAGAGYNGTPVINNSLLTAHPGAVQTGALGGAFSAAVPVTGTATGLTFTYSEVGNFRIGVNGVFDNTFVNASTDQGNGDCTSDFSNVLVGGRYGCSFGNSAPSAVIGRFTPDHFDVSFNAPVFAPACTGFTYVGQAFNYSTAPVITVTARNAAGLGNAITRNYTGVWQKIATSSLSYPGGTSKGYRAFAGTLDVTSAPNFPTITAGGAGAEGTVTLTFGSGSGLFFTRVAAIAPFDADISLAINVIDGDNVVYASNPAKLGNEVAGGGMMFSDLNAATANDKSVRFGRLRVVNASGSQLVPLPVPLETQYWGFTNPPVNTVLGFITNTADSCTRLDGVNIEMFNYQGALAPAPNCRTRLPSTPATFDAIAFAGGRARALLSAPAGGVTGSVDLRVRLEQNPAGPPPTCTSAGVPASVQGENATYLQGNWSGAAFDQNPAARARFGIFKGADEVIFIRENFQ